MEPNLDLLQIHKKIVSLQQYNLPLWKTPNKNKYKRLNQ